MWRAWYARCSLALGLLNTDILLLAASSCHQPWLTQTGSSITHVDKLVFQAFKACFWFSWWVAASYATLFVPPVILCWWGDRLTERYLHKFSSGGKLIWNFSISSHFWDEKTWWLFTFEGFMQVILLLTIPVLVNAFPLKILCKMPQNSIIVW